MSKAAQVAIPSSRILQLAKPRTPATLLAEWDPVPKPKPHVSDYNRLLHLASEWVLWPAPPGHGQGGHRPEAWTLGPLLQASRSALPLSAPEVQSRCQALGDKPPCAGQGAPGPGGLCCRSVPPAGRWVPKRKGTQGQGRGARAALKRPPDFLPSFKTNDTAPGRRGSGNRGEPGRRRSLGGGRARPPDSAACSAPLGVTWGHVDP